MIASTCGLLADWLFNPTGKYRDFRPSADSNPPCPKSDSLSSEIRNTPESTRDLSWVLAVTRHFLLTISHRDLTGRSLDNKSWRVEVSPLSGDDHYLPISELPWNGGLAKNFQRRLRDSTVILAGTITTNVPTGRGLGRGTVRERNAERTPSSVATRC